MCYFCIIVTAVAPHWQLVRNCLTGPQIALEVHTGRTCSQQMDTKVFLAGGTALQPSHLPSVVATGGYPVASLPVYMVPRSVFRCKLLGALEAGVTYFKLRWPEAVLPRRFANYLVRQFNSRNGPVKATFAYLCSNGYCPLRNAFLVKLRTSWDDGATAGNSFENRFSEYLAVTFSRCVGCQKGQQIFVPSGHVLILERAKNRRGLSQVNKVDGPIL